MVYTKNTFIKSFLISYEDIKTITSHYSYIILIFSDAGYVVILSIQEALRFNYIKAMFETNMKTDIKKFNIRYEQYYYFVPQEFYIHLDYESIHIFKYIFNYPRTLYKTFEECGSKRKDIIKKDYDELLNVLGYNYFQ